MNAGGRIACWIRWYMGQMPTFHISVPTMVEKANNDFQNSPSVCNIFYMIALSGWELRQYAGGGHFECLNNNLIFFLHFQLKSLFNLLCEPIYLLKQTNS